MPIRFPTIRVELIRPLRSPDFESGASAIPPRRGDSADFSKRCLLKILTESSMDFSEVRETAVD